MEKKAEPAIERYLAQSMSPQERQAFEARLRNEPALVAELALTEALRLHSDQQLKNKWAAKGQSLLQETPADQHESHTANTGRVRSLWPANSYRWAIAATFALLVAAAGIWYYRASNDTYGQLYAAQYERLASSTQLSAPAETPEQQVWDQAFAHYTEREYDKALEKVNTLTASPAYRNSAHLLAGACYLEQNRPDEAIRAFQQVERGALSLYQKAQFNIALAYIRAKDAQAAKTQLKTIADDPDSRYRGKAREMLDALE